MGNFLPIPSVEGFAPFPNSIMVPFMGYQSAILAYNFGIDYELGKRTVKSFPNDLFNEIRAGSDDIISVVYDGQEYKMKYNEYIPFLKRQHAQEQLTAFRNALPDATSLMGDIINFGVQIEKMKIPANIDLLKYFIDTIFVQLDASLLRILEALLGLPQGSLNSDLTVDTTTTTENYATLQTTQSFNYGYLNACDNTAVNTSTPAYDAFEHVNVLNGIQSVSDPNGTCQEQSQYSRLVAYAEAFKNFYGTEWTNIAPA